MHEEYRARAAIGGQDFGPGEPGQTADCEPVEVKNELGKEKRMRMLEIDKIRQVALNLGFQRTSVSKDGSTVWFSKPAANPEDANRLMCIDLITRSGTVFWKKGDSCVETHTFRSAESLACSLTTTVKKNS